MGGGADFSVFCDGFVGGQPLVTMVFDGVHRWSDDGMVMYHC